MFVNNTKIYFDAFWKLVATGTPRQDAYDIIEAKYREKTGEKKYSSFESFLQSWYQFYNGGKKRPSK